MIRSTYTFVNELILWDSWQDSDPRFGLENLPQVWALTDRCAAATRREILARSCTWGFLGPHRRD
jgi:hypothetical protein